MEKFRESNRKLHIVLIHFKRPYGRCLDIELEKNVGGFVDYNIGYSLLVFNSWAWLGLGLGPLPHLAQLIYL